MGWWTVTQVWPAGDAMKHELEDCPCIPREETTEDDRLLVVHHSLDGRELNEPDHDEDPDY